MLEFISVNPEIWLFSQDTLQLKLQNFLYT